MATTWCRDRRQKERTRTNRTKRVGDGEEQVFRGWRSGGWRWEGGGSSTSWGSMSGTVRMENLPVTCGRVARGVQLPVVEEESDGGGK